MIAYTSKDLFIADCIERTGSRPKEHLLKKWDGRGGFFFFAKNKKNLNEVFDSICHKAIAVDVHNEIVFIGAPKLFDYLSTRALKYRHF